MAQHLVFDTNSQRGSRLAKFFALTYILPIIYVSLFPFSGWTSSGTESVVSLFTVWPRYITRTDVILNFLAYAPLGFLVGLSLGRRFGFLGRFAMTTIIVASFSISMEMLQIFLPSRTSSSLDLLCNSAGGILGAIFSACLSTEALVRMSYARDHWFAEGAVGNIGLTLVALWPLSQLNPTIPLFSVLLPNVLGAKSSWNSFDLSHIDGMEVLSAFLGLATVGMLLMVIARSKRVLWISVVTLTVVTLIVKISAAIILLRPEAVLHWISAEVIIAGVFGAALAYRAQKSTRAVLWACVMLVLFILIGRLDANGSNPILSLYLFSRQYSQFLNYIGLSEIAGQLWPIFALGYLVVYGKALGRFHTRTKYWP